MSFYESDLFITILLGGIYILLAVAVALIIWSAIRTIRLRQQQKPDFGMPQKHIVWGVTLLLVLTLGITYLLGSSQPLSINGDIYQDVFWLRLSDMFINSTLILLVIAAFACGFSMLSKKRSHS